MKQALSQSRPGEIFLLAVDHQGCEQALPAIEDRRVMAVICHAGIDLRVTCRRACAGWPTIGPAARLHPPVAEEEDRLCEAFGVEPASRLCHQIVMSPGLKGPRMRLAPGAELE